MEITSDEIETPTRTHTTHFLSRRKIRPPAACLDRHIDLSRARANERRGTKRMDALHLASRLSAATSAALAAATAEFSTSIFPDTRGWPGTTSTHSKADKACAGPTHTLRQPCGSLSRSCSCTYLGTPARPSDPSYAGRQGSCSRVTDTVALRPSMQCGRLSRPRPYDTHAGHPQPCRHRRENHPRPPLREATSHASLFCATFLKVAVSCTRTMHRNSTLCHSSPACHPRTRSGARVCPCRKQRHWRRKVVLCVNR